MQRKTLIVVSLLLVLVLAGCRNETQNQIRRSIQDFTNTKMYVTLYGLDGTPIFTGVVDGKVTRAASSLSDSSGQAAGSYIFWYDDKGQYFQSDLPYIVTTQEPQQ